MEVTSENNIEGTPGNEQNTANEGNSDNNVHDFIALYYIVVTIKVAFLFHSQNKWWYQYISMGRSSFSIFHAKFHASLCWTHGTWWYY